MEQRISIVTLGVSDLKRARAFYDALGWKIATEEAATEIVAYNLISMTLCLYPLDKLAEDVQVPITQVPVAPQNHTGVTLAYNVDDEAAVDATLKEAVAAGGQLIKPAQKVFWGGYSGYFADPDGHLWEVAHNPFSPLGSKREFQWGG